MDAIREAGPLVAAVPELSQAADETHSDLHRALSEVLRVAAVCSKKVGTVPDDPTGEMHDGVGGFYESMQHMSVMRAFAPRLGGYLSGLVWRLFLWRNGMPACRSRALSGCVR